jgi:tetratricopeptide (TPR) repeat protein/transcriptional regulator with XRE-family HTH domain
MTGDISFAQALRRERESRGWSQEEVASRIGCDVKTVARWEGGKHFPRVPHGRKISELFGKSLEELHLVQSHANGSAELPLPQIKDQQLPSPTISQRRYTIASSNQVVRTAASFLPTSSYVQAVRYRNIRGLPPPTHPSTIQQRERVVKALYKKLVQPNITALVLTGIGGVGKSTLAALVYCSVLESYQAGTEAFTAEPLWLTISEQVTMADVVGTLFEALEKPLPRLKDLAPSQQVMVLFHALKEEPHARLIVLDQFENVLDWQTGHAMVERPGVSEWLDALNSQPCVCRILLTSRIWPKGKREYPPTYMQEYVVDGLSVTEGVELLRKQGVGIKQATDAQLRKAVTHCDGHALALTLLASILRQDRGLSLSQLSRDPLYTDLWQKNIAQQLLDYIYTKQLDELQRQLLFAFAIYREPIPLKAAQSLLDSDDKGNNNVRIPQLSRSLRTLLLQHLLQAHATGESLYGLHAIVLDYIQQRFIKPHEQESTILSAYYRAARYYLQQYAPPLEQRRSVHDVHPFIEAAWHLCKAQRWQEAYDVIYREDLYQTLRRLGEQTLLLEIYRLLQSSEDWHPEQSKKAEMYDHLGRIYAVVGKKQLALQNYERALQEYEVVGDCPGKGRALHHLGLLYESLGQKLLAKEHHERALAVSRKVEDSKGEADSLNGLGWIYYRLGQQEQAIQFCEQALALHREKGNRIGESDTLNALGLIYHEQEKWEQALQCHEQSLSIRRELGNREKEGKTLNHLGLVYAAMGQVEVARKYYKQSFIIRREVGDQSGEGSVLYNLGKTYFKSHDYDIALTCWLRACKILKSAQQDTYEAAQRWIETLREILGEQEFLDLKTGVEAHITKLLERALL